MTMTPSISLYDGPRLTIVTPTVFSEHLNKCLESVFHQTKEKKHFNHLVVFDGKYDATKIDETYLSVPNIAFLQLPWNTGAGGFNGHRIYAATSFLINTDYVCWLDEDNWIDPTHVESLFDKIIQNDYDWGYSLRNIYNENSEFVCHDQCESLGFEPTCLHEKDHLIDVSCYCIKTNLAWQIAPLWYRRAREPGMMEVDRAICSTLISASNLKSACTNNYTVNYRCGNRGDSVKPEFFLNGNKQKREEKEKNEN